MKFNHGKLKDKLEEARITNAELDRRLGWVNMVYKYTNGTNTPSPELLFKILFGVGLTADDLKEERLIDWYSPNGS